MKSILNFSRLLRHPHLRSYNREAFLLIDKVNSLVAEEGFQPALKLIKSSEYSNHPRIRHLEADLNLRYDNPDESLQIYKEILDLSTINSEKITILINMSQAYLRIRENDLAIECLKQAVKIDTEDPEPLSVLGSIYAEQGKKSKLEYEKKRNFETALSYYDKVISLDFEEYE